MHGVALGRVRNGEVVVVSVRDARILRAADERIDRIIEVFGGVWDDD